MDFGQIFQAVLALVFVLGLLLVTLWFIKLCQQKGLSCRLGKTGLPSKRLTIVEQRRIDAKNTVVLVKCDSEEFLILLGSTNLLLQTYPAKVPAHD